MLDLVFVRFEVLNAKGNAKAATEEGKGDAVGAYTISVGALMPGTSLFFCRWSVGADTRWTGYRHFPLYDTFGDQHLFSTLFVKSKVTQLD